MISLECRTDLEVLGVRCGKEERGGNSSAGESDLLDTIESRMYNCSRMAAVFNLWFMLIFWRFVEVPPD